ncbi:hypothetical protein GOP47_0008238 [Adiantum capillus-veneris]|uniref:K-box domain-containing protein n=1 Tax=Adiantum capillus-veneris TaxID=13818 RepID=A0A9D4UYY6_ADICA|nr:hypothetical protein GOP47_0008238 [Adiantum capillus-veneris]
MQFHPQEDKDDAVRNTSYETSCKVSQLANGSLHANAQLRLIGLQAALVATLIFSSTGRLSEFAAPSMSEVLKKYHETPGMTQAIGHPCQNLEFWKHEAVLLKKQIDFLQLQQSYVMGENLTCFQLKDLEILESRLCVAINKIKEKKVECFQLHAQEMAKKEHLLLAENTMLRLKIADLESKRHRMESSDPSSEGGVDLTRQQSGSKEFNVTLELGLNRRYASS